MRITDFDVYKNLLIEKSGLTLTPDKSYLLDSRLGPVAKKWGYPSLEAMTIALQGVPDRALINDIVEAMTTNETSFFRDAHPFELFKDVVLKYMAEHRKTQKKIRIWCAAASSGQEPYSLCIALKESGIIPSNWRIEIIATDISDDILNQAREAKYSQFEVQRGLPIQLLLKYFTQEGDKWSLNQDIKNMVTFQNFNLLNSMTGFGQFDIIFCRNVLIYFNEEIKGQVLGKMAKQLANDGFLFLGGAETVLGITTAFKPLTGHRGLYVQPQSPLLASEDIPKTETLASSSFST